jgi:hypothetical protein
MRYKKFEPKPSRLQKCEKVLTKKFFKVLGGLLLLLFSLALLLKGFVWGWGWGIGGILLLFGLFEEDSDKIKRELKEVGEINIKTDLATAEAILTAFTEIGDEWSSNKNLSQEFRKLAGLQGFNAIKVVFSHRKSLLSKMSLSFIKSKDQYAVRLILEGQKSKELFERKLQQLFD